MAVTKVSEDRNREASLSHNDKRTTRLFQVTFNTADDPKLRPLLALTASDGTTSIPKMYSQHPGDSWLYVKNIISRTKGPFDYDVTVEYGWPETSLSEGEPYGNPLEQEPEVSWSFETSDEPIDRDIYGKPITNSAGHSFDPPITRRVSDLVLHYKRNQAGYNPIFAANYIDHVNSDNFLGFSPGFAYCNVFSGERQRAAGLIYWTIIIEIKFRLQTVSGINYGWLRRILDEGFMKKTGTNQDGTPIWERIKDYNNETVIEKVKLNGNGDILPDPNGLAGYWLAFEVYPMAPFSLLGIS